MEISLLEWFGYLASVVVAISLLMGTIVKLRIYNLVGSSLFSAYGFLIDALPVAILNGFIALVNIYYLYRIYHRKEYFRVLPLSLPSPYLSAFVDFYNVEIRKYFPNFTRVPENAQVNFAVLRNMAVASVFVGRDAGNGILEVLLDYAIPEYRDLKPGKFIYVEDTSFFTNRGFTKLVCKNFSHEHLKYLRKLGFTPEDIDGEKYYSKNLNKS